ncbi:MAG: hypothetical protein ACI4HI_13005 [Lachnospiraceae bacterium]
MKKGRRRFFTMISIFILLLVLFLGYWFRMPRGIIDYEKEFESTAVTVDQKDLTLHDLAFYIAYEEGTVEQQAILYNSKDTNEYWNLHTNGVFIKKVAQQSAMDMAVHDEILSSLAKKEQMTLDEKEKKTAEDKTEEFWNGLLEEQQKRILISKEEAQITVEKIALAEKYQQYLAEKNGRDVKEYGFEGDAYKAIRNDHTVTVNKRIWKRLDFGNVTLQHVEKSK